MRRLVTKRLRPRPLRRVRWKWVIFLSMLFSSFSSDGRQSVHPRATNVTLLSEFQSHNLSLETREKNRPAGVSEKNRTISHNFESFKTNQESISASIHSNVLPDDHSFGFFESINSSHVQNKTNKIIINCRQTSNTSMHPSIEWGSKTTIGYSKVPFTTAQLKRRSFKPVIKHGPHFRNLEESPSTKEPLKLNHLLRSAGDPSIPEHQKIASNSEDPTSCRGRCGGRQNFPCSCTDICVVNGNCCSDVHLECPRVIASARSRLRHLSKAEVECSSLTDTFMVMSCPTQSNSHAHADKERAARANADKNEPFSLPSRYLKKP